MKKLTALLALSMSLSSFAVEVNFTYFGNEGGRQSFYSCDYVEAQAESYLEIFGARNVEVYCSGGIQPWGSVFPVSLNASFDLPAEGTTTEVVEIEGDTWNPACGINVRMINEFLKVIPSIKVLKKTDHCAFHNSNYYYKLSIPR